MTTSKNQSAKTVKANVNTNAKKETKKLDANILAKASALVVSANIQGKAQISNEIFKKGFQEKNLRKSAREKMFKYCKQILLSANANDMESLIANVELLNAHATKFYIAETKFEKVSDYYTSVREDESTKEKVQIMKTAFELANAIADDED